MTFGTLAVISLIAILGPLLALPRWNLPVVLGELIAGIALGAGMHIRASASLSRSPSWPRWSDSHQ
jgi:Kef-type K+ transport system membrane component KefB